MVDWRSSCGAMLRISGRARLAEAMAQLTLRHGHLRQAKTGILDAFFALYAAQTRDEPKPFLDWLREDYDEAALKRDFRSQGWADRLVDGLLRRE